MCLHQRGVGSPLSLMLGSVLRHVEFKISVLVFCRIWYKFAQVILSLCDLSDLTTLPFTLSAGQEYRKEGKTFKTAKKNIKTHAKSLNTKITHRNKYKRFKLVQLHWINLEYLRVEKHENILKYMWYVVYTYTCMCWISFEDSQW